MTSRRRAFRTSAVLVAMAATAATAGALTTAQADNRPETGIERHDPAPGADHHGHAHEKAAAVDHDLKGPFSEQQAKQREAALEQVLSGESKVERRGASKVVKLDAKKYVELGREKTDKIFTILVEFGDKVDNETLVDRKDDDTDELKPKYGGTPGPLHNQIAKPDRKKDNSTAWQADYDRDHFQDLYFGTGKDERGNQKHSLKTYYERTSSGRYSVDGTVSDWVKVEYNEARYGSNFCGQSNCSNVWDAVRDGVTAWSDDQKAKGKSDAEIKAMLAEYDQWDRYDFDGDGDFNEADGYIDHFQIVHAGEDESAGGGAQGGDALWAHRWYAYGTDAGKTGPADNKAGGTQIGSTGIWVGDYTMQPENGGLGVFAHEYGHDLGLPDLYDTSGRAGAENSTGFWSLMSSGSWLGTGKDSIGDMPGDMTSWDKLQLGWLDYEKAKAATKSRHKLGVSEYNTKNPQALIVELPKKRVTTPIVKPAQGATQWWSNMGDDLKNTLSRSVDLTGKSAAQLSLDGWWDIEDEYDYLYAEVSTDGGARWTALDGTADGTPITKDAGGSAGLTGVSGAFKKLVYPLDAYAGKKVDIRFRYQTDGGVAQKGFAADNITVTADGAPVFSDDAETEAAGWESKGFSRIGESISDDYPQYYIAENRQYVSYDATLKVGPYNFGFGGDKASWVEHYPYQTGLLIWKWDTSQKDNNTAVHPGEGLVLPIDAHAKPLTWADGTLMRNRVQSHDAPFSRFRTDRITLHKADEPQRIGGLRGNPVFDDRKGVYWFESNPRAGVKVNDTNTRIAIVHQPRNGQTITVQVGPSTK
ncbi:immune inhibitor A domain-containing protein [Streptomyces fradiae]|uniref:immune inhibitor A domain-containing protein n=1 Tax=Streptomyces fradiae TaxID=1906 RepID=UPI0029435A74|nr:immune inhibitor A domain-containing protein [Streptomyces fradiae]WOI59220.1 immune inhibitor A [Streptomyces fradiae]